MQRFRDPVKMLSKCCDILGYPFITTCNVKFMFQYLCNFDFQHLISVIVYVISVGNPPKPMMNFYKSWWTRLLSPHNNDEKYEWKKEKQWFTVEFLSTHKLWKTSYSLATANSMNTTWLITKNRGYSLYLQF